MKKTKTLELTITIDWDRVWEEMDEWENDLCPDNDQYREQLAKVIHSEMKITPSKRNKK